MANKHSQMLNQRYAVWEHGLTLIYFRSAVRQVHGQQSSHLLKLCPILLPKSLPKKKILLSSTSPGRVWFARKGTQQRQQQHQPGVSPINLLQIPFVGRRCCCMIIYDYVRHGDASFPENDSTERYTERESNALHLLFGPLECCSQSVPWFQNSGKPLIALSSWYSLSSRTGIRTQPR